MYDFVLLAADLINLESSNMDSCSIQDDGLVNLASGSFVNYIYLPVSMRLVNHLYSYLTHTEVGSNGLRYLSGLADLQSLNLLFTLVTDGGLGNGKRSSHVQNEHERSLNLDVRQITDTGLASLRSESNDVASSSFRMFSNEDVTIGAWMLAMNVNHEDDRQLCQPGWLCNPEKKMLELHKLYSCANSPTLPSDEED
ncbi:probable beta-1,3-galactosyltransferase 14 [Tanacetum coccineum]